MAMRGATGYKRSMADDADSPSPPLALVKRDEGGAVPELRLARSLEEAGRGTFVHIDANIFQGTLEACTFAMPRLSPNGLAVFDDYNGVCDLGARLAIDAYFAKEHVKPRALVGSSAYVRVDRMVYRHDKRSRFTVP